ncbi:MAG TPA: hypothetical protein VH372_04185 [Actinospica sp.]|jgi:hypothetical protein|nr:hypothetical protein [Actinospica sp.]
MGDSFTAVPPAIAGLGAEFEAQGQQLAESANGFSGSAFQIGEAFGLLGACDGALQKYQSMLRSTMTGLGRLAEVWAQTGRQLIATAQQYQIADERSAERLAQIGGPR